MGANNSYTASKLVSQEGNMVTLINKWIDCKAKYVWDVQKHFKQNQLSKGTYELRKTKK